MDSGIKNLACVLVCLTTAQVSGQRPAVFEAASVKPHPAGERGYSLPPFVNGRFRASNVTLKQLIATAWGVQDFQVEGATGWIDSERFDVDARMAEPREGEKALQAPLQALLAARFHLRLHTTTRQLPLYRLSVARGGVKLTATRYTNCSDQAEGTACGGFNMRNRGELTGGAVTTGDLADMLAMLLHQPVRDETGLSGKYDMHIAWTPDDVSTTAEAGSAPSDNSGPSLFTALQEQVGLRLESGKGPVTVYIVDSASEPTPN